MPHMTGDLAAFGCEAASDKNTKFPGKLVVALMSKPTAELDGWDKFKTRRIEKRKRAYERVLRHARQATEETELAVEARMEIIKAAWGDMDILARTDPLGHDYLCYANVSLDGLVEALLAAATEHGKRLSDPLETSPVERLQCSGDHRRRHVAQEVPWRA